MLTVFFLTVSLVSISDYRSTDFVVSSTVISVYRDVSTDCCSGRDNNILLMCALMSLWTVVLGIESLQTVIGGIPD